MLTVTSFDDVFAIFASGPIAALLFEVVLRTDPDREEVLHEAILGKWLRQNMT